MSDKFKPEIKHLKLSVEMGILEYKIHQPKKGNGCALSFMPMPVLKVLAKMINDEIKHKQKKQNLLNTEKGETLLH